MIYAAVVALALASSASARLFTEDATQQKALWENFKAEHKRSFATMEEENHRFNVFLENLKVVDLRNERERKAGGSAEHGITKFSDMSQAEFESTMLSADVSMKTKDTVLDATERTADTSAGLVDWTGKLTTPVKDQGYCGSCWAFSATEQIESDAMRTLGASWKLSAEQITQCTTGTYGCNGGWTEKAFTYATKNAIVTETTYPYTSGANGVTGSCKVDTTKGVVKVTGTKTFSTESSMASYVQSTGPLSICIDANNWNSYKSGIMSSCGTSVDHCVQAVGVDASSTGYWKVRNQWGTSWGESGFIRLAYGKNTCAITNDPIYTTVVKA